jgi:hypothetical protein
LLASDAAYEAAGMRTAVERRQLDLKGVSAPAHVRVLDALGTVLPD